MPKDHLNKMSQARLLKIVVNVGIGRQSQQPQFEEKILPEIIKEVSAIVGQRPKTAPAKKSISGFKIRTGQVVGLVATLRGKRSRDFLARLVNTVLPRIKDFRGISLANVDKSGNLNMGLREQFVFPEISPELSRVNFGMEITLVVDARDRESAIAFYRTLGMPLRKSQ